MRPWGELEEWEICDGERIVTMGEWDREEKEMHTAQ